MRTLTVEASQPDAEKACLMTNADSQRRKPELDALFAAVVENTSLHEGQVMRLQGDPEDLWEKVTTFIEEEKVCCPFFSFEARELADGVELTITGARLGEIESVR
jgi:hypothetical protein